MSESEWVRFDAGWFRVEGRLVMFRFDPAPPLPDPYVWALPATTSQDMAYSVGGSFEVRTETYSD